MYTIRPAQLSDLPVLLEFEQKLIETERPMDPTIQEGKISYYSIEGFIKDPEVYILVAELDGKILASGYARPKPDRPYLKHELFGHLGFMYVDPESRGLGLNKLIVDELIAWCDERGLREIRLDVYQENPSAIRAYEKAGFKKHLIQMRLQR